MRRIDRHRTLRTMTAGLFLLGATIVAADGPQVRLADTTTGRFLTERVILATTGDGSRHLRTGQATIPIGEFDEIHAGEGIVTLVSRDPAGRSVRQYDDAGGIVDEFLLDTTGVAVPFGRAVALLPDNHHEPGVPFDLVVVSGGQRVRITRPGYTILDLRPLESHLLVGCRGPGSEGRTTGELIDEQGSIRFTFDAPGGVPPRVAVRGSRAAAVYPGRSGSTVELREDGSAAPRRWSIDGVILTQVALESTGTGLLVWGPRAVARIDSGRGELSWRAAIPGAARPLASGTPTVMPVDGSIGIVTREAAGDGAWELDLILLNVDDGRLIERRKLHRDSEMPTQVGRYPGNGVERLVLRQHVYEILPADRGAP